MGDGNTVEINGERSLEYAQRALQRIRTFRNSATPRNFEVWYRYESEPASPVRDALNAKLNCDRVLTDEDCDEIFDRVIACERPDHRLAEVSGSLAASLHSVNTDIASADLAGKEFQLKVAAAAEDLERIGSAQELAQILAAISDATADAMRRNEELLLRLDSAKGQVSEIKREVVRVNQESLTDALTQVANRKAFNVAIRRLMSDCRQMGEPLALLMIDVDHFKLFNDTHGHPAGDQVLRLVGHLLTQQIKGRDFCARYGGEEFAVILPQTLETQALSVGDKLRRSISSNHLRNRKTGELLGKVTMSVGIAIMDQACDADQLVDRADRCLYAAKRLGRNRVVCESDLAEEDRPPFAAAGSLRGRQTAPSLD